MSVGLTKDVQFVPAKNTSVIGAGIDGQFIPINDPEAVTAVLEAPNSPVKSKGDKGKEKATGQDDEAALEVGAFLSWIVEGLT